MKAQFLTLDGIDGSGKSTHLETMREWFERRGMPVLFTREPGGTPLGEELRRLLLSPDSRVGLRTETLLMFAAVSPMPPLPIRAAGAVFRRRTSKCWKTGCRAACART